MANEITVNIRFGVDNGFLQHVENTGTLLVDQSVALLTGGVQKIGTAAEALQMNDVATAGYAFMRNVATANFIELGTGTGTNFAAFMKLKYGECCLLRLGTSAPTAKANTAESGLYYMIFAD